MTDHVTHDKRSQIMASVGTENTGPELTVRSALHRLGFRFRLHRKDLPGSPDLVFPKLGKVVFVNGCFWHGHRCRYGRLPKSRVEYWRRKIETNKERDRRVKGELRKLGWKAIVVWQCQLRRDPKKAIATLAEALMS